MRIVFFGSPAFAVPSLTALVEAGHDVTLAVTQPAKPAGRKAVLTDPAVALCAQRLGIPVFQPVKLRTEEALARIRQEHPDFLAVAAYGKILPQSLLDLPSAASVNVHGSLLPRWRGASPIQASLLAGDEETGISIMRMVAEMDAGPVYAMQRLPILDADDTPSLTEKLAALGAGLLVQTLPLIASGALAPVPQNAGLATFCPKIEREDGRIDWTLGARKLWLRSRAFSPWPGLFCYRGSDRVKVSGISFAEGGAEDREPGTVVTAGPALAIQTARGLLCIGKLQRDGRKELSAREFVRGERVQEGEVWQ